MNLKKKKATRTKFMLQQTQITGKNTQIESEGLENAHHANGNQNYLEGLYSYQTNKTDFQS